MTEEEDQERGVGPKRSASITNIMPWEEQGDVEKHNGLSKAEKKQIKRDLLEFAKRSQGLTKENLMRKNLIETKEAQEAKICEDSQASRYLNDHRKNVKKAAQ